MSEEEIIEENIRRYIKEHSTTIKAYTQKYVDDLQNKLQQKENIIKEVREYIEEHKQKGYREPMSNDYTFWNELNDNEIKQILEILDKGE